MRARHAHDINEARTATTRSATVPRDETAAAPLLCASWGVVVADGDVLVVVVLELLEGQPTPLYVARMSFAACSATPYTGACSYDQAGQHTHHRAQEQRGLT